MSAERDECQAKLDIMMDAFIRDDWAAYRDAVIWLRDFVHQKNIVRGRVMCGRNWFMPQKVEVLQRARRRDGNPMMKQLGSDSKAAGHGATQRLCLHPPCVPSNPQHVGLPDRQ
jgi:hypothetical protein